MRLFRLRKKPKPKEASRQSGGGEEGQGFRENPGDADSSHKNEEEARAREVKRVRRHLRVFTMVVICAALFIASTDSFYTLAENEMAVVTTFGVPASVTTSGPKFKYPFIQKVYKMSREIKGMSIGYESVGAVSDGGMLPFFSGGTGGEIYEEQTVSVPEESEMITKDFNFVNVDFYIEYQVIDPIQAYIHTDTAVDILKNLAQSYIRDTVGSYSVDEVITTGKAEIQATVRSLLSARLEQEGIGLGIVNVTIQDAEPPTQEVSDAFKAVEDAKQGMDTMINEARKYQSEQLPAANARADQEARQAEAYVQERISEAEGQAARFNEMYDEYVKYPLITKKRMLYEALEEVLPGLKVIINGSDGTQSLLPLAPFNDVAAGEVLQGGLSDE